MKKFLPFLVCLFGFGGLYAYPSVSQDLTEAVHLIYQLPEGREILGKVESEGAISISSGPFNSNSSAMWNQTHRMIVLNTNTPRSFGQKLRSIFFELHNAMSTKDFNHLDSLAMQGKISRESYVQAIEHIEYQNALKTNSLIKKGISWNLFPRDSFWNIPSSFEEHYDFQLQCGHAAAIAMIYDRLQEFYTTMRPYAYSAPQTR